MNQASLQCSQGLLELSNGHHLWDGWMFDIFLSGSSWRLFAAWDMGEEAIPGLSWKAKPVRKAAMQRIQSASGKF